MKKLLLLTTLLVLGFSGNLQAEDDPVGGNAQRIARRIAILNACNLILTTTDAKTYYYYVSSDEKALMELQDSCIVLNGDTYPVASIRSMKLCTMPRIILNEDSTYYNYKNELDHGLVALRRSLVLNQWNDLCLPFSMTGTQVTNTFGEGTQLARMRGMSDEEKATVELEEVNLATEEQVLQRGYHYLLKPTLSPDVSAKSKLAFTELSSSERPYGPIWLIPSVTFARSARGVNKTYYNSDSTSCVKLHGTLYRLDNTYKIGTYVRNPKATPGAYYLDENGQVQQSEDSLTLGGMRVWMENLSKDTSLPLQVVLTELDGTRYPVAIQSITNSNSTVADFRNNAIYDLSGRRLQRISTAGIYIIDGKKVYVK